MKKKSVFLSKVFAVALAASMAFSTPYASAETISTNKTYDGEGLQVTDSASVFAGVISDLYRVSGDFDVTINFTNKGDCIQNWNNYIVFFTNAVDGTTGIHLDKFKPEGYKEYLAVRADLFSWAIGDFGGDNTTLEGNKVTYTSDWGDDWDAFKEVMRDAKVALNIKRTGDDFVMTATLVGANSKTYTSETKFTTKADKDMNIILSGEAVDIKVQSFVVNNAETPAETPDAATDSVIDATPETPDTTTPETPDATTPETPAEDTTTPETPAEPEDTTTAPVEDEEKEEEETVKAAAKLNKKKATVKVGKSVKLKVQNTTKKVTWSSSNKKVAKVNKSGKVTGVKAGKAVIKAKVGGKTLKCNVTVK